MSTEEIPEPIWSRPEPGSRTSRFSRDLIAAKATEIADAEGIDAVSMRRVASELGAGTMTLYHYVKNKRELYELMHDAKMGQLLVADEELDKGWREGLTAIAKASLDVWRRHGWTRDDGSRPPVFGPNGMRHFEQSLRAASSTGLPHERRMEIIGQVDDYVAGYALSEQEFTGGSPGEDEDEEDRIEAFFAPINDYMRASLAAGEYPNIHDFIGDGDFADAVKRVIRGSDPDQRFERGLNRLLDGIALEIEREAA